MTGDGVIILRLIFSTIWRLFTSWHIPGTHATPASMAFLILIIGLILRNLKRFLEMTGGGGANGD